MHIFIISSHYFDLVLSIIDYHGQKLSLMATLVMKRYYFPNAAAVFAYQAL